MECNAEKLDFIREKYRLEDKKLKQKNQLEKNICPTLDWWTVSSLQLMS